MKNEGTVREIISWRPWQRQNRKQAEIRKIYEQLLSFKDDIEDTKFTTFR